ncbi:hypothetical protein BatF92_18330 [Bacteroides thetaiotaomicron]|jgi:hypothetical protein|nr:hypothetical protein BatF92_18330 [Bacteroides thetaiotaomicron]
MILCFNPLISENMKTIYRVESPTGEVRVLEVSRNETGYNVYIDDSNICESITEEELTEALENPNF